MLVILIRTLFIYTFLMLMMRLLGKRQIGELKATELVTALLISEIASLPVTNPEMPVSFALIPMIVIVGLEIILSFILVKLPIFRSVLSVRPSVVISKGELNQKELKKQRITTDELMCMEQFDNEDKIREYTDGFQEKVAAGNIKEALDVIREGIMYFPEEYRLKCLLMYGLYLSCDRPAMVKHYSGELLALGEEILDNCTDDPIRLEAKRLLCLHYYEDLRDTESAREIAMSLPGK